MKYSLTALLLCLAASTAFAGNSGKTISTTKVETTVKKEKEKKVMKKSEKKSRIAEKKKQRKEFKKIYANDEYLEKLAKDMRRK